MRRTLALLVMASSTLVLAGGTARAADEAQVFLLKAEQLAAEERCD